MSQHSVVKRSTTLRGAPAPTVVLALALVLVLCGWTVGVAIVFGSRPAYVGLTLQLGATVALGIVGAALGVRMGAARDHALRVAAAAHDQLRAALADGARTSELIRAILDTSPMATMAFDRARHLTFWSPAAEKLFGWSAREVVGGPIPAASLVEAEMASSVERIDRTLAGDVINGERVHRRSRRGRDLVLEIYAGPLRAVDGSIVGLAGQMVDITDREAARVQLERLGAAIDQTVDGVVIADARGIVVYVNPAYEKQSGYPRSELIGADHAHFVGQVLGDEVHASMATAARAGAPWFGEVEQQRADATTSRVQLSVTPILTSSGAVSGFVAFQHDVTYVRAIEGDLALEAGVRGVLGGALHLLPDDASLEQAAQAVCDGLCSIPGIDFASVDVFLGAEDSLVLALTAPTEFRLGPGVHLSQARSRRLFSRAGGGSWAEYWSSTPEDGEMGVELDRAGLRAFAYGPIVHGDHVDGGVVIGTSDPAFARTLVERVPGLVDFTTAPSGLLADRLHGHRRIEETRAEIAQLIDETAFYAVFQPMVELSSGEIVGYEALTRFDCGRRPDLVFADARTTGLGTQLEVATLRAAVAAAAQLPPGCWLDLNVSPSLLAEIEVLRECIGGADRPVVLEVTEHEPIADYPSLREAVRSLGPNVRLAVDDAGAGIANFAHIVELDADLVKLDISLVRGLNLSPGRQALVIAMRHFARSAGCRLVAEGVETEAEAAALAAFGVEFGQGYWFGRPTPLN